MLKRLELHAICSHMDTAIEFGEGKNILIGPTGSGKTSILTGIEFAFLGSRIRGWTLGELVNDGATQGEVNLEFINPSSGQTYRITRTISRSKAQPTKGAQKKCEILNLDTGDRSEGDRAVGETLTQLGFDPDVFTYVVHMRQGEFTQIIEESQRQREVLDRLFKVSDLEHAYGELGKREGSIQVLQNRLSDLETKAQLHKQEAEKLEDEKKLLLKLQKRRKKIEKKIRNSKARFNELKALMKRLTPKVEALRKATKKIEEEKARQETLHRTLETFKKQLPPTIHIPPIEDRLKLAEEMSSKLREEIKARRRVKKRVTSTENEIRSLLEKQQALTADIRILEEEARKLRGHSKEVHLYLGGKGEQPTIECDKCGSKLTPDQWTQHLSEVEENIQEMDKKISPLNEKLKSVKAELGNKNEDLKGLQEEQQVLAAIRPLSKQVHQLSKDLKRSCNSRERYTKKRCGYIEQMAGLLDIDKSTPQLEELVVKAATETQTERQTLQREIPRLEEELVSFEEDQIKPQQKRVEKARKAAKEYEEFLPKIARIEERIRLTEEIRTTLREVQPIVREQFVQAVSELADSYFISIYSGNDVSNIRLTRDYNFLADRGGYVKHVMRLSGGQRVAVSIAFLLALSELLSTTGFVILDEPTTHLDEKRREDLVKVLSTLQNIPQLVIVDHHPELKEAADLRFNVALDDDGWSIVELET